MPFKSQAQMRKCFASKNPRWNCREWLDETPGGYWGLPERVGGKVRLTPTVHPGPRGGLYYVTKSGRKRYVTSKLGFMGRPL